MGKGFFADFNNLSSSFDGTEILNQCIYSLGQIEGPGALPPGWKQVYLEDKNSGNCYFTVSAWIVSYAYPGISPDLANFALGFSSGNTDLNLDSPNWQKNSKEWNGYTVYAWTLEGGVGVYIESFGKCGDQGCYEFKIGASDDAALKQVLPAQLTIPADGSDYQGQPAQVPAKS